MLNPKMIKTLLTELYSKNLSLIYGSLQIFSEGSLSLHKLNALSYSPQEFKFFLFFFINTIS